jgi:co-chaperonin GroES (HSP10)
LCGQYAGDDVKVDGKEFKIVAFDYILAKIN